MDEIVKEYTNGEVTIVWKPGLCIHASYCWKELGEVFNPNKRPWVDPYGASTEQIINQVKRCPSGALTCYLNAQKGTEEVKTVESPGKFSIEIVDGGPLLVHGDITFRNLDGTIVDRQDMTAFCRCGLSKNQPYCDGSHKKKSVEK